MTDSEQQIALGDDGKRITRVCDYKGVVKNVLTYLRGT